MPYSQPEISEYASYKVSLQSHPDIVNGNAIVDIAVWPGDENWTQVGVDGVFQQLLDLLASADFLVPRDGAVTLEAYKNQAVNSIATPTSL